MYACRFVSKCAQSSKFLEREEKQVKNIVFPNFWALKLPQDIETSLRQMSSTIVGLQSLHTKLFLIHPLKPSKSTHKMTPLHVRREKVQNSFLPKFF